ncbi:MAG: hypothetical protein ACI31R_00450 [Bacilli bacterium]
MENILKIIYDKSQLNKTLDLKDIEKILDQLIIKKQLNEYISNMKVQQIRSKKLASYSNYTKTITIYSNVIDLMIQNINNQLKINDDLTKNLYINLSILQVIMHEVEHANQEKIIDTTNNLESFILKLSELVPENSTLYECTPEERLAEIKSYKEILSLISIFNSKPKQINELIEIDSLQRSLRGYHYENQIVTTPLMTYFEKGNKPELLAPLSINDNKERIISIYNLEDRFKYGLPIMTEEYISSMSALVKAINKNFKNRVLIK